MRRFTRHAVVFFLTAAFVMLPVVSNLALAENSAAVSDNEDSTSLASAGADLLAVRPLGIASTVVGFAAYVVSLPFSIPGGNSKAVWEKCVVEPADYTFKRPIGEF